MTVWMAAEGVYPACRFKTYAVLGDDIVLAGLPQSMRRYWMIDLGVTISRQKSLISNTGAFFRVR